jgi:hypothetical protein
VVTEDGTKFSLEIPWQNLQVTSGPIDGLDSLVIITRVIDLLEVLRTKLRQGFLSPKKIKHLKFIDAPGDPLGNLLQKSWQDPQILYKSFCWEAKVSNDVKNYRSMLVKILLGKALSCPGNNELEKFYRTEGEYSFKHWKILHQHVDGIINRYSMCEANESPRLTNGEFINNFVALRIEARIYQLTCLSHQLRAENKKLKQEVGHLKQQINNLLQKEHSRTKWTKHSSFGSKMSHKKSPMKGDSKIDLLRAFLALFKEE